MLKIKKKLLTFDCYKIIIFAELNVEEEKSVKYFYNLKFNEIIYGTKFK